MAVLLEDAIFPYLRASPGVNAFIGDRVYPDAAPDAAALPYITYSLISSVHERHLGGNAGVAHPRVSIDCWGVTSDTVNKLVEQVRLALDGFQGTMSGLSIDLAYLDSVSADFQEPTKSRNIAYYRKNMTFIVWHEEEIP